MRQPNIVLILADDLGYSDIGCYGGEIRTPNLDRLGRAGVRMSQFYNTARCSPSRASLLTGLHPHQTGIGILANDDGPGGYPGSLNERCVTAAEVFGDAGYATCLSGKWHLSADLWEPAPSWPTRRGFAEFFGTISGCGSYYDPATLRRGEKDASAESRRSGFFYTDAISDHAVEFIRTQAASARPFFAYVSYTAPHWPLHAPESDVAAYDGVYDAGWDELRERRLDRLRTEELLGTESPLSRRDPTQPPWAEAPDKAWQARRMQVYAAQVERMDRGIGRILDQLDASRVLDDTLVVFLSDNGGCAEELPQGDPEVFRGKRHMVPAATRDGAELRIGNDPSIDPGPEDTYASYGRAWANLSNTPFRFYKRWVHEGGIATPFIVHWPAGLSGGSIVHTPFQLTDVLPTLLAATGVGYPARRMGREVAPLEGRSMVPALRGEKAADATLFWEHIGNAAVRRGRWKLVSEYPGSWELYDMHVDRSELTDLAGRHPELVAELAAEYDRWARRVGVIPRDRILRLYAEKTRRGLPVAGL
ncbi:sulfatase [Actinomadura sp. NBRC 104412]|uniref:arylsulfatase n=1 Tax=Actinomadura sp. NBRC 104412 TaxID=3032203 RepID=UPI0024A52B1A|nr:arylsulfatase [Actinomadura sp. NBRC 104412]GLZ07529.1 sulfatase [Actinomadura sp. NBRC 104412]